MTADELVKINKDVFIKMVSSAVEAELLTLFPYLATNPLLLKYVRHYIEELVTKVADRLELAAYFLYTDYRVDAQGKEFVAKSQKAYDLELANASPEELEQARKMADGAFKKFFKFTT